MAVRHGGLAGVDVRRAGHAPLYVGRHAVRRGIAGRDQHRRSARRGPRLLDSSRVSRRLGGWRRILRADRRSHRTQPGAGADDPHLCPIHRAVVFRAIVAAVVAISVSGGAGDRRGMGGGGVAVVGNVAPLVAALDRGRAANGGEYRRVRGRDRRLSAGEFRLAADISRRHHPGAVGVLDSASGARDGRMERCEGGGEGSERRACWPCSGRGFAA